MKAIWLPGMLSLLLGGCAASGSESGRALPPKARFASLGSSFAAGAGIGPLQAGTPERCSRTTNNYATLLAARLDLNLVDASCGGATSEHVLRGWSELPPQIDALDRETRLVTITVGGNDLGYVGWLFASSCRLGVAAFPGPCRPAAEPTDADYARLDRNLRAIAQQVRVRAPQARLVFVQYVTLLSDTACGLETVTPADAAVARRIAQRLASVTDGAARASGADVLDADRLSRSHTPCSPEPWSNGLSPGYNRTQGAPWHPNAAGHAAIARELASLLQARPALSRK